MEFATYGVAISRCKVEYFGWCELRNQSQGQRNTKDKVNDDVSVIGGW